MALIKVLKKKALVEIQSSLQGDPRAPPLQNGSQVVLVLFLSDVTVHLKTGPLSLDDADPQGVWRRA